MRPNACCFLQGNVMHKFKYAVATAALLGAASMAQAGTLEVVQKRGEVQCGVTTGFAGFSAPDAKGQWQGLDVDLCRAVAAATLGDASKFKAVPLNSQQRFTALQSGEIDLLARNTTVTQQRDTRSEEHTSELQSLMRRSYAVFCLKKKKLTHETKPTHNQLINNLMKQD